jgi:hypothetical protein
MQYGAFIMRLLAKKQKVPGTYRELYERIGTDDEIKGEERRRGEKNRAAMKISITLLINTSSIINMNYGRSE